MTLERLQGQVAQRLVDQGQWGRQGLGQWLEGGLTGGQRFGVTHELEAGVDGIEHQLPGAGLLALGIPVFFLFKRSSSRGAS